jgi:transposase-like protein
MTMNKYTSEQIINKLREAKIHLSQGNSIGEASRKIGVTEQTYYRWRLECPDSKASPYRLTQSPANCARVGVDKP